jgi:O-methyltransferase involved in polyketide biosynthesis
MASPVVDPDVPNVARIYDYFLGGTENFPADRAAAAIIARAAPDVVQRVRENREFLGRAVRFLAAAGIRQFIDVGAGLPTRENVHQVAGRLVHGAHVAYVDNDPAVVAHAQVILAADPGAIAIEADLREPALILSRVTEQGFIDLAQPVGILMLAVLHFIPDDAEAARIVATFREQMTTGSYLAITHATAGNLSGDDLTRAVQAYASSSAGSITLRTPGQIGAFFQGLELEEPGAVPAAHWRAGTGSPPVIAGPTFLGGLARKAA